MLLIRTVSFLEWNGSEMLYFSYQFEYGLNTVFAAISYYVWTNNLLLFVLHVYNQSSLVLVYNASWHVMTDLFAYPRFTCGFVGGGSVHIVSWLFFMLPRFSYMVSAIDYSLLKHVL